MTAFGALLLIMLTVVCLLLWRVVRAVEWLCMFVKGFSDKFIERSQELREREAG